MKRIALEPDFEAWRAATREALRAGYLPEELDLEDASTATSLTLESDEPPTGPSISRPQASKTFLESARIVAAHRDPSRWNLLYRILHRLQTERTLLQRETDPDIRQFIHLKSQVQRDLNRMQAFVRFHKVLPPTDPSVRPLVLDEPIPIDPDPHAHHLVLETPTPFGPIKTELESCPPPEPEPDQTCDHYISWHRPEHRILPLAAPWFAERFSILRWTILTPEACVWWNPETGQISFGAGIPGVAGDPQAEELEAVWRSYRAGNPALTLV